MALAKNECYKSTLPCPNCKLTKEMLGVTCLGSYPDKYYVECPCCDYRSPSGLTKQAAITAHNNMPRRLKGDV